MHPPEPQTDRTAAHQPPADPGQPPGDDFARSASRGNAGLLAELWTLVRTNRKWWLAPIIIVLLVIGVLLLLGSTAAAPFIYPLF